MSSPAHPHHRLYRLTLLAAILLSAALLSAVLAGAQTSGNQTTHQVPQDFPTIQAAINASAAGDTISVAPGTYTENLQLTGKSVHLVSTAGAATTLLDGSFNGPVLSIANIPTLDTTVSGFTIQHGLATSGAVALDHAGAILSNNTFLDNSGNNIAVSFGSVSVLNNTISTSPSDHNAATNCDGGAGISVLGTTPVYDSNGNPLPSTITGNTIAGDGTRCAGTGIILTTVGLITPHLVANNIIRNNALALNLATDTGSGGGVTVLQNLIYDNANGAIALTGPTTHPSTDPSLVLFINNTIVNNLTQPAGPFPSEISLTGTAAHTAFLNTILVGSTSNPVLTCDTGSPTYNDTPLLLDHTDLYNTAAGPLVTGDCFTGISAPLSSNGNLSVDPHLTSSTDLHLTPNSSAVDAGTNSAPGLTTTDLDGNPRVLDATSAHFATVDLGAYEYTGTADSTAAAVTLTASTYQASPAATLTLTAIVIATDGTHPPGTITFTQNATALATPVPTDTSGTAKLAITVPNAGVLAFTAAFTPNAPLPSGATVAPTISPVLYVATLLPSTLAIQANSPSGFAHQPLLLTIHLGSLTTANVAGPIPGGAVALYSSTSGASALTFLTTLQPDLSGNISYTLPDPASGPVIYSVRYAGNTTYAASSANTSITLIPTVDTTTTLTASPGSGILGSTITLSASVSSASTSPIGAVRFTDGTTLLGTVPLTSQVVTLTTSHLALGSHTLAATFVPAPGYTTSSATALVTIVGASTTTTLTTAQNPAAPTDLIAYTATVTLPGGNAGPAPTGVITLTDGATLLASGTLLPTSASTSAVTLTAADAATGPRTLTATYTPAPAGLAASTGTVVETITAAPIPAVTLGVSPNPAPITTPLTLITTLAHVPAGATLTLLDGATPLPLNPSISAATYTLSAGALTIGTHTLTAVLRDAHANLLATSAPIAERITGLASTLALTASPAPTALFATPVTLSAALTSVLPPGHTPAGAITFLDGSLVLGSTPIDLTGHASLTTSALATGTHTLIATWSGDDLLSAPTPTSLTEQILLNPTTTTLTLANPGTTAFAPVTLAAQVTSPSSTPINTAVCSPACAPSAVTFFAGQIVLGTVSVDATGHAALTVHPEAGPLTVSAAFSGSPLFAPSTSAPVSDTITVAPTALTFTGSPNPLYQRGSVTLTATLSAALGVPPAALAGAPITLLEGTTPLGTITSPTGTLAYAPATTGTHTLTATFPGTADLAPASATLVLTVLPSDFTVTVRDTALTIPTEHHAPTTVTVSITGDLADTIDLTCDNPPAIVSCTFSPATMSLSAAGTPTATADLIIDTDFIERWATLRRPSLPGAPASPPPNGTLSLGSFGQTGQALATTLALLLPTTWLLAFRRPSTSAQIPRTDTLSLKRLTANTLDRRRFPLPNLLAAVLLTAIAFGITACGSTQPGHTPPGTYPLTITAHARTHNYSHTATVTLTITP